MVINKAKFIAYVGTYTTGDSKGIYRFTADIQNGKIDEVQLSASISNPTYLYIDKNTLRLYTVAKINGKGGVASFSINNSSGSLELIDYQVSAENPPCHVSMNNKGNYLFSSNYHSGSVKAYPVSEVGSIDSFSSEKLHEGSGPNNERQERPHVHYSALTPDEKYLCVIDLGIDSLVLYDFENGGLFKRSNFDFKSGSGPRHMAFHPNARFAYIITELSSEIVALEYSHTDGCFMEIQNTSALPEEYKGENLGSAIHFHPSGKFLYVSNRGHDSIAAYRVDSSSGRLVLISHTSSGGSGPRDFAFSPDGNFLYAANQNSNNITVFSVDESDGELRPIENEINVPNPVCIKFAN